MEKQVCKITGRFGLKIAKAFLIVFILIFAGAMAFSDSSNNSHGNSVEIIRGLPDGLYAVLDTAKGKIVISLEYKKTPITVMNFVGLAEGTLKFENRKSKHFYDGLIFHRVVPNFIIQTGDPLGDGSGGPGYFFPNEIRDDLKHDKAGVVAMANMGPNTNGSQFYITMRPAPWLDGLFTIFGHVVKGQNVVSSIVQGDKLNSIRIFRIGKVARAFEVDQAKFDRMVEEKKKEVKRLAVEKRNHDLQLIKEKWPNAKVTGTGLEYIVLKKGTGTESPQDGMEVTVNYEGSFLNGKVFDSSYKRGKPATFRIGQVIEGWNEALKSMKKGEKRLLIIPPELAYGEMGYPGVIPPSSFLVFTVELIDF